VAARQRSDWWITLPALTDLADCASARDRRGLAPPAFASARKSLAAMVMVIWDGRNQPDAMHVSYT
jgi:hypothetical protein